ncbi:MATE family efflux transporter [Rheinheimera marina]|uniref:Multidrug-efflux transporter n=1 Tax=Rheinheimera marina TaxID=1774958 RepID=A0ABV9JHL9_9GAMM
MTDLTQGPVHKHLVSMGLPMMIGMLVHSLYLFVDLYFVSALGASAVAAVGAGAALMFLVMAFSQVLGVGTVSLMAVAIGAKRRRKARQLYQQGLTLALGMTVLTALLGFVGIGHYMQLLSDDPEVQRQGYAFLQAYLPGLCMAYLSTVLGSGLRSLGIVKPAMLVQLASVGCNIVLAPVLIAGWGTGLPLGVAGAGLASTLSGMLGFYLLYRFVRREQSPIVRGAKPTRLSARLSKPLLKVGFPAGGEYGIIFLYSAFVYWVIADMGTEVQAAFGIGLRVVQALSLPAVALSFAIPAVAGQNFGAKRLDRVRQTFVAAAQISFGLMGCALLMMQWQAEHLVAFFTSDIAVIAAGTLFVKISSWNFLTSSLVLCCSGMFQALGNTLPSLLASLSRLLLFMGAVLLLQQQAGFYAEQIWWTSVVTVLLQGVLALYWLDRQLRKRGIGLLANSTPAQGRG